MKRSYWSRGLAYLLACCVLLNTSLPSAFALLDTDMAGNNGLVAPGTTWGDHTVLTTGHGAIIDWSNFNTTDTQSVTFNQLDVLGGSASATSAVLNRIASASATQFDGALTANGRVFVVNPAGIVFGGTATINVTQLVASGLNISNFDDIVNGTATEMIFDADPDPLKDGEVTNIGHIEATDSIHLVGKQVLNRGVARATNGLIVMAAGDTVRIAQDGSNVFVDLVADPGGTTIAERTDVENRSLLSARNGRIVLAAADTFGRVVSHAGQIIAASGHVRMQGAYVNDRGPIIVRGNTSAALGSPDGGTVELIGADEVVVGEDKLGIPADIVVDGVANGAGGSITLQSGGTVTIEAGTIPHAFGGREDVLITAKGGSTSGDGGSIKIIADDFYVAPGSIIDASPQDLTSATGTLEIESPTVTIAAGANVGAVDTVYEEDIETLSTNGTSVIVRATGPDADITVEDIPDPDNQITGGRGGIELHATGINGSVTFTDTADTISTTHGDIVIEAGSGGATIGSLETGDPSPLPGQITLTTTNGGDITAQNLTIKAGRGRAEIAAHASGDLTINGNVIVGRDVPIQDVFEGAQAEALVDFSAGDHVVLNGTVTANSQASVASPGGVTKSEIKVFADTLGNGTGDVTINGNLTAIAVSNANGTSDALVHVETPNRIYFGSPTVLAIADGDSGQVHVEGQTSDIDTNPPDGDVAEIIINQVLVQGQPDFATTHMGTALVGDVLANDGLTNATVSLATDVSNGTLTLNPDGTYTYAPNPGYVGDDTFTYTATVGSDASNPILVTITMNNTLPTATDATATTHMGTVLNSTIQGNIADADGDPLTTGLVTDVTNGTLALNVDGTYTYTPNAGYVGSDSFTYSVADPQQGAVPAQATVTINMTNGLPTPVNDTLTTQINTPVGGNVLGNDIDPDSDPLTALLVNGPSNHQGTFTLNSDGSFTYTPKTGFKGQDTFTYSASDPQAGVEPGLATVTITVTEQLTKAPPAAPGVDVRILPEISGTPALVKWVSAELGIEARLVDVWFANTLASSRSIAPFYSYSNFKRSAKILQDAGGIYATALGQVINEFASSTAPPTEEQLASIAGAISGSPEPGSAYALAGAYVDSLEAYTHFLVREMGFSQEDAVVFITTKYVDRLAEEQNVGVAAFVAAELADMFTDTID